MLTQGCAFGFASLAMNELRRERLFPLHCFCATYFGCGENIQLGFVTVARIMTRIAGNDVTDVKSSGRNKIVICFKNLSAVNRARCLHPGFSYHAYHMIKNVLLNISEDILKEFNSLYKILSVKRLSIKRMEKRRVDLYPLANCQISQLNFANNCYCIL